MRHALRPSTRLVVGIALAGLISAGTAPAAAAHRADGPEAAASETAALLAARGSVTCVASAASPHKSKGEEKKGRHVMLAKVNATCTGNLAVSNLTIDATLQKKVGTRWVNATSNEQTRYRTVKLGKKYTGYTRDLTCQSGTFRARFRVSGMVQGTMHYGNWAVGPVRNNPCA